MPSVSAKQARFMNIAAHSPEFAKKAGISQSVASEFHAADKARHRFGYADGGAVDDDIIGRGRGGVPIRGPYGFFTQELPGALGALGRMLYGGARGAATATLGMPGELERLGRGANAALEQASPLRALLGYGQTNPLDAATSAMSGPTLLPDMSDVRAGLTSAGLPPSGTPHEALAENVPLTPGQAARLVRPAAGALGRLAAEGVRRGVEEGRGPLAALRATVAPLNAVRVKGGNFDPLDLEAYLGETLGADVPRTVGMATEASTLMPSTNQWLNKQLKNYIAKDLGSTTDPLLAVEAEGRGMHALQDVLDEYARIGPTANQRARHWKAHGATEQNPPPPLTPWGAVSDDALMAQRAARLKQNHTLLANLGIDDTQSIADWHAGAYDPNQPATTGYAQRTRDEVDRIKKAYGWLDTAPPDTKIWRLRNEGTDDDSLGFAHVRDYLEAAQRAHALTADPGVLAANRELGPRLVPHMANAIALKDAGLALSPEQLERLSVADAVRKTRDWNELLAKSGEAGNPDLARGIKSTLKEYPEEGLKWVELGASDAPLPKDYQLPEGYEVRQLPSGNYAVFGKGAYSTGMATHPTVEAAVKDFATRSDLEAGLNAEGKAMGHCVGGYCDEVASRGTRILSLRDKAGNPHVTVEIRPKKGLPGTSADYPEAYTPEALSDLEEIARRHFDEAAANDYLTGDYDYPHVKMEETARQLSRFGNNDTVRTAGKQLQMDLRAWKERHPGGDFPPEIVQIKGKQNAAPVAKYQPMVQDLVKNLGPWGRVGDLQNTGLTEYNKAYHTRDELEAMVNAHPKAVAALASERRYPMGSVGELLTRTNKLSGQELKGIMDLLDDPRFGGYDRPEVGYAEGGSVEPAFAAAWDRAEPAFAKAWRIA